MKAYALKLKSYSELNYRHLRETNFYISYLDVVLRIEGTCLMLISKLGPESNSGFQTSKNDSTK